MQALAPARRIVHSVSSLILSFLFLNIEQYTYRGTDGFAYDLLRNKSVDKIICILKLTHVLVPLHPDSEGYFDHDLADLHIYYPGILSYLCLFNLPRGMHIQLPMKEGGLSLITKYIYESIT
ncbi:hypothetical protein EDC96DRAFT_562141 [Choanephora cucurbitarum]|nr:hypothetical protein EDC96DRAFT_562141 [Choanephora cucurbitarum]